MRIMIVSILLLLTISSLFQCANSNDNLAAYLLVYFKDETHGLYIALSPDGYRFTDINNGNPIMAGDTLALQKGVRDPHILRGPDGRFCMAMTDLHIYAKEAGYRNTQWERDGEQFGWGNNRALVLMKSDDLIRWSRTNLRVDTAFEGLEEIGSAWAPEIIYDQAMEKLMLYYTMRFKNGVSKVYYTYMNDDFTEMETRPQVLFEYPKAGVSYIDADITLIGDKYHMFYVAHDGEPGIKQAVSDSLHSGYVYDDRWINPEPKACEAPNVWKRLGTDTWVLMYDIYGIQPHNFGFSETTDFEHFSHLGHFNEDVMKATNFTSPKHGSIIHLTKREALYLAEHWGFRFETDL